MTALLNIDIRANNIAQGCGDPYYLSFNRDLPLGL